MRTHIRTVPAGIGLAVAGLLLAPATQFSASATPTGGLLQPAGASFAAAFPAAPRVITGGEVLSIFPGALSATEYFVSSEAGRRLAARSSTPPVPTYIVVSSTYATSEAAEAFVSKVGRSKGSKPVLIQNVAGYQTMNREVSTHHGKRSSPRAFESAVAVSAGDNVYLAFAFQRTAASARAFTHSIELASGPAALPGSSGALGAGGGQPAQLGVTKSTNPAYRDGRYAGYGLVALLVLAIVFKYARKPRRSAPAYPGPAPYGGPPLPPGAPQANSQFAWMYQGAEPPAGPPPE